jgi:hypothetical protein
MLTARSGLAATAIGLALLAGPAAHATTVLNDTFDSENGGASALNYTGFANWKSTGAGGVDLVATPDFGIACAGGGGSCVDLAGTPGPGQITSLQAFGFHTGQRVTLSFDVSGNQRVSSQTDDTDLDIDFNTSTLAVNYTVDVGSGPMNFGAFSGSQKTFAIIDPGNAPWSHYTLAFTVVNSGTLRLAFGTHSGNNVGPLLDNVNLDITGSATPEPATWALMLGGFGLAGAALRRRKAAAA